MRLTHVEVLRKSDKLLILPFQKVQCIRYSY
ncbi:hypothetical protein J802_1431, partial [Acinetobacter baumannii 45002_9]